jgi:histidinol-phosphate aminotransferase
LADADILVRGYAVDGVRITLADRATNDRVLAVLANRGRFLREAAAAQ